MEKSQTLADRAVRTFGLADLMLLLLVLIWGGNFTVVKTALQEISPLAFTGLRFALATVLNAGLAKGIEGNLSPSRKDVRALIVLGLVGNTCYQLLFINGIARSTAGNTSLVLATVPIFVALISGLTGRERVGRLAWMGILLSFGGIFLISQSANSGVGVGSSTLAGDLLTLVASFSWAVYTIRAKPLLERYSALKVTAWAMITGTPLLVLFGLGDLLRQDWGAVSLRGWLGLLYSSCLALVIAYVIWNEGVRLIGNTRTAIYSNLIPVVALIVAALVLGESITAVKGLGALIVLVGVYLTRLARRGS